MSLIAGKDPQGKLRDARVSFEGSVVVEGKLWKVGPVRVPGVGAGAAYAAGDAFGTMFSFFVPVTGATISEVTFLDYDDEGLRKDFVLFEKEFTGTADNAAFNPSDADLRSALGVVSVDVWYNFSANQIGVANPAKPISSPRGQVWCQIVTQGADNIAAGSVPEFIIWLVA